MKVLITGARGQLGHDLVQVFDGHTVEAPVVDITDRDQVLSAFAELEPDVVVHAAAWTAVDDCESDPDRAWRVNALGSRNVAAAAAAAGSYLCALSTDYVFDGRAPVPYTEWDETNPLGVYGRSKRGGEQEVLRLAPGASVVRTSWLCGAHGNNFVKTMLRHASGNDPVRVVADQHGCPTFCADLAMMIRSVVTSRLPGVLHVTNAGATTWHQLAREVFALAGADGQRVEPITTAELDPPRPAPRPANSVLDNAALRGLGVPLLHDYHEPLEALVKELLS